MENFRILGIPVEHLEALYPLLDAGLGFEPKSGVSCSAITVPEVSFDPKINMTQKQLMGRNKRMV